MMFQSFVRSSTGTKPLFGSFSKAGFASAAKGLRKARVVVVGSGRMGQIRAGLIRASPRFELCGIVDTQIAAAQSLAEKFDVESFVSLDDAISLTSVDKPLNGIIVSSPTFSHEAIIKEAGDSKLAVFTEKPVDETAEKIESIFRYSEAVGIELCCGFQRRFDPSYVAATDAVMRGEIGKPVSASIFCADHPCPPKKFLLTGGNIFMDLSAHDVDYIIHTLQDEVVSVYATGTSSDDDLAAVGVHDNATMIMNFHQGAVVTLFLSRFATYGYDQRCEIFGSDGLVSVKNVHSNTAVVSNKDGIHQSRLQHSFPQRFNEAFALELNAFADTVLLDKPWPVTADQCVRVQRVADAARLSADCGQVVAVEPYKRRPVVNAVPSL